MSVSCILRMLLEMATCDQNAWALYKRLLKPSLYNIYDKVCLWNKDIVEPRKIMSIYERARYNMYGQNIRGLKNK